MRANKSSGSRLELAAEELLHGLGFVLVSGERHWRGAVGCTPDLVCHESRIAVFVHGCYWHGCEKHYKTPKTNSAYWGPKIAANRRRDRRNSARMRRRGWAVLVFWEHDFKTADGRRVVYHRVTLKMRSRSEGVLLGEVAEDA